MSKNKKYKKIYCCGDCVQYNMKKHKCALGCHKESDARNHFYDDCPYPTFEEDKYRWHDLRKDATDLPKAEAFYFAYGLEHNHKTNNNNYVLHFKDGKFEFDGEDGFEVVAWKDIEPFEVEE